MTTFRSRVTRFAVALAALACNEGLAPQSDCPPGFVGICGRVSFHGTLPDSTDAVYIVAYATFPTTPNDLVTFLPLQPPNLQLDSAARATLQPYAVPLPPGTYHWVLAVWKKIGILSPQNADNLLREAGFYRDPADPSEAGVVVVNGAVTGVDFTVDFTNMHPVSYYFPAARPTP
jgi:hypothetical protein